MKKIIIYSFILTASLMISLAGCSESDKTPAITKIESGVLDPLPFNYVELLLPDQGTNPQLVTATWSSTKFILDGKQAAVAPVTYNLEIDKKGANFANAVTLASSPDLAVQLYVNDVNKILVDNFEAIPKEEIEMEIRLVTTYGQNGALNRVFSPNVLALTLIPFNPPRDTQPVYIIGNMNEWDNSNTDFMMFRDDSAGDNFIYTYTGRIAADTYFKFCPQNKLGSYVMYCQDGDDMVLKEDQGMSFYIEKEGYYTIEINVLTLKYSITPYEIPAGHPDWAANGSKICFVGSFCDFGSKGDDPEMTPLAYDPHIWVLTLDIDEIGYGVKFRVDHSWNNRWCPEISTNAPYGKAIFNPTADPNIDLAAQGAGHYFVKFNDLTNHYIVMKQDN
ncbi:MAG: SusF/SusE family outer membrane protein [Dysgonamonadaceae bacterium]|jgi:hypothetical protein|nr:SusF/SusE family outer membrane protein [Dysgonamonadaceae bacterium]